MRYTTIDISNGVATLTLNDPDKRNAINLQMNDEICEALDELEASEEVGSLVVTGAGKAFCAGADLGDLLAARERDNIQDIYRVFCGLQTRLSHYRCCERRRSRSWHEHGFSL